MSTPLVLLHGWGLSSAVWAPLRARLDPALPVVPLDLPGHGSAAPAGDSLADWADALRPHIPDGATVVGWSLGAQLALHLAARAPDAIARLVLIGASPRFVQADDWPCAMPADTLGEFRRQFDLDPAAVQKRFVALQALGDSARRDVVAALGTALTPADAAHQPALACGLRLLADTDQRALVAGIRQPTRVLHGSADTLMPVAAAEWLADTLPDGRLTVFQHSGHAPFLSRPADCATLLESFIRD
ncbi:alpha/beta fold hydrolase [Zoogloea sp.]|uniref:alpha/beta fold hydrolase n=1 Tax=Zoogloea sp. TaxID=49181 RepID=UPI0035B283FC